MTQRSAGNEEDRGEETDTETATMMDTAVNDMMNVSRSVADVMIKTLDLLQISTMTTKLH